MPTMHQNVETTSPAPERDDRVWSSSRTMVVPIASTADAERILPTAAWFARRLGRPAELLTVVGTDYDVASAIEELAVAADQLRRNSPYPVRGRLVISDDPAAAVVSACQDRLVVMATSASPFREDHYVGSYAAAILARSTQPVVVVGPSADQTQRPDFDAMVVGLSGDPLGLGSLPASRRLADALGMKVHVVHVVEPHEDQVLVNADGEARLWFPDSLHTSMPVELADGPSIETTLAKTAESSLLVMATHARCGLRRIADGSVAFDVVEQATGPLVLMGPHVGEHPVPRDAKLPARTFDTSDNPQAAATAVRENEQLVDEITYTPVVRELKSEYIVVLDGSERAAEAITAGLTLGARHRRDVSVLGVARSEEAAEMRLVIDEQMAAAGCPDTPTRFITPSRADAELQILAEAGHVIVVSAFGTWRQNTRVFGLLSTLVAGDAPSVIGVGPHVSDTWSPGQPGPLVVCLDESPAADAIVEHLDQFIDASTTEVMVVHIDHDTHLHSRRHALDWSQFGGWDDVAKLIEQRWGVTATAHRIAAGSVPSAIATFASTVDASLIVMASYHRPRPDHPTVASASLATVAYAPCPVAILTGR